MMTDEQLSLITTAVDGELSPAETLCFRRLLDSLPDARTFYVRLKADSDRLRNLPQTLPPANLHQRVMAGIAAVTPSPSSASTPLPRHPVNRPCPAEQTTLPFPAQKRQSRRWIPVAVAASLLLAISGSSFLFFSQTGRKTTNVARNSNRPPPATHSGAADPEWAKWLPFDSEQVPVAPTPNIAAQQTEPRVALNDPSISVKPTHPMNPVAIEIAPEPRSTLNPNILGSELRSETPPLDHIRVRVPFLKPLTDFDREDTRQQFAEELTKEPSFRIDVFTRNMPRSVEWFCAAAKTAGVTITVDPSTLERVNKGQVHSVVIYTESLTSRELADLFAKLNTEDAKVSPRVFDVIHAMPIVSIDQEALRSILGVDPGLNKRSSQEKGSDSGKPISAGTADQIVKNLTTGQGKNSEKSALMMTWLPTAARTIPASSAELKQFLLKRGERKPNAVPVAIVIRHANG